MKARSQAKPKRYRRYEAHGLSGTLRALPRILPRPEWRVNRRTTIIAVLLLFAMGAALFVSLGDVFYVTRLSIVGNTRTPAQEIAQISEIGGKHILWINQAAAAERVANGIPSIKSARVECQLPGKCVIRVQEREPRVVWQFGGAVTWVADDGLAFAARVTKGDDLNLVSIEAPQGPALLPGKAADPRMITAVLAVTRALPKVRHYRYTPEHGLEFESADGFSVYLGLGENMADRAMLWQAAEDELAQQGITPRFVDLRFPTAPYFETDSAIE
jgi:cell division septal protein FtsQ